MWGVQRSRGDGVDVIVQVAGAPHCTRSSTGHVTQLVNLAMQSGTPG
jgi:hypothetical protein